MSDINRSAVVVLSVLFLVLVVFAAGPVEAAPPDSAEEPSKLAVLWTSGDRDVAINMVYMYTYNAKKQGWWDTVQFIVWGPSSKLLSVDVEIQEYLAKMKAVGVDLYACKACADMYGIADQLASLGLNVKLMGGPLTELFKSKEWKVVTF